MIVKQLVEITIQVTFMNHCSFNKIEECHLNNLMEEKLILFLIGNLRNIRSIFILKTVFYSN